MAGRVEQDPHVLLRLELGQRRPQRHRVLGRSLEVGDLEVEVQLHLRVAGTGRPYGRTWFVSVWKPRLTGASGIPIVHQSGSSVASSQPSRSR
jgi:hypothetical protein